MYDLNGRYSFTVSVLKLILITLWTYFFDFDVSKMKAAGIMIKNVKSEMLLAYIVTANNKLFQLSKKSSNWPSTDRGFSNKFVLFLMMHQIKYETADIDVTTYTSVIVPPVSPVTNASFLSFKPSILRSVSRQSLRMLGFPKI